MRAIRRRTCWWTICYLAMFACGVARAGEPPAGRPTGAEANARWVAVLGSQASTFEKATACRMLGLFGDKNAVPALAGLLGDKQLAAYARTALETIPAPEAVDALHAALPRLSGELLTGAIASVGKRRDPRSVSVLHGLLDQREATVTGAAARALGDIGNAEAAAALQQRLAACPAEHRPLVAIGGLACAGRLVQTGQAARAIALYDAVRAADVPRQSVLAATQRVTIARGVAGLPLLREELAQAEEARFRSALQAARGLGRTAAGALVERLAAESPARRVLLVVAIGDVGDRDALPSLLAAARKDSKEVRVAAIGVLGRWNEPNSVPSLLEALNDTDRAVVDAARAALALLTSDAANAAVAGMLESASPQTLSEAIALAGQRRIASAAPALFRLAERDDVGKAALAALGAVATLDDLPKLIALATTAKNATLQTTAREALRHACARLPREVCVTKLIAAMRDAPVATRIVLLESMAAAGGPAALAEIVAAARSRDELVQFAATRLLGGWMTPDAAGPLLDLAKTLSDSKYRFRSLRGYIRIARQLNMTPEARLAMCRNALAAAERREERALAVEALGRVGTAPALALAVSLLDDREVSTAACSAIVTMAGPAALAAPEATEQALTKVLAQTTDAALKTKAERQLARARDLAAQQREETLFVPLFDGRTLEGWVGDRSVFRVEDGAIVGGNRKKSVGSGNDFLYTTRTFGDFELRFQVRLVGEAPNGGVNFRSNRDKSGVASGYQADIGQTFWGCLYDEARRNRVIAAASPAPTVHKGEWNDYRVRCEGRRIRLWVNGSPTIDYTEPDASIAVSGILALQVQAGQPCEAWYRNLRIRPLGKEAR